MTKLRLRIFLCNVAATAILFSQVSCKPRNSKLAGDSGFPAMNCDNTLLDHLFFEKVDVRQQNPEERRWQVFGTASQDDVMAARVFVQQIPAFNLSGANAIKFAVVRSGASNTWKFIANQDMMIALLNDQEAFRINHLLVHYTWVSADEAQIFLLTGKSKDNVLRLNLSQIYPADFDAIKVLLQAREKEIPRRSDFDASFSNSLFDLHKQLSGQSIYDKSTRNEKMARILRSDRIKDETIFAKEENYQRIAVWGDTLVRGMGSVVQKDVPAYFYDILAVNRPEQTSVAQLRSGVNTLTQEISKICNGFEFTALASGQQPRSNQRYLYVAYYCEKDGLNTRGILWLTPNSVESKVIYNDPSTAGVGGKIFALSANRAFPPLIALAETSAIKQKGIGAKMRVLQQMERINGFANPSLPYQTLKSISLDREIVSLHFDQSVSASAANSTEYINIQTKLGDSFFLSRLNLDRVLHGIKLGSHKIKIGESLKPAWKQEMIQAVYPEAVKYNLSKNLGHNAAVEQIVFGPNCMDFVTAGSDGSLQRWSLADLVENESLSTKELEGSPLPPVTDNSVNKNGHVVALKATTDRKRFFSAYESGKINLWTFNEEGGITGPIETYEAKQSAKATQTKLVNEPPTGEQVTTAQPQISPEVAAETQPVVEEKAMVIPVTSATWLDDDKILAFYDAKASPQTPFGIFLETKYKDEQKEKLLNCTVNYDQAPDRFKEQFDDFVGDRNVKILTSNERAGYAIKELRGTFPDFTIGCPANFDDLSNTNPLVRRLSSFYYVLNSQIRSQRLNAQEPKALIDNGCKGAITDLATSDDGMWIVAADHVGCVSRQINRQVYPELRLIEDEKKGTVFTHENYYPGNFVSAVSYFDVAGKATAPDKTKTTILSADAAGHVNLYKAFGPVMPNAQPATQDLPRLAASFSRKNHWILSMGVADNKRFVVTGDINGQLYLFWIGESIDFTTAY